MSHTLIFFVILDVSNVTYPWFSLVIGKKSDFFPQNMPAYRALFLLFCPIIQCVFTPKIPKKFIFPQIEPIIQGTLVTFLPKKMIFSSKWACISSTILTCLPNNPVCFYTKNFQKVNFSSNFAYNAGHFIDLSQKKSDFFLKMRLHNAYQALFWFFCSIIQCVFTPEISKKLIFPQISPLIQSTLLTSLPKKWFSPQNATAYPALFWHFCPILHCVFTPKIPKKLNFPQIVPIAQGTLLTFLPKNVIFF